MKLTRRLAMPIGTAVLILAWWAATSGKPVPVRRSAVMSRGAPGASPDRSAVATTDAPAELEPPAPVLRQSAERRFSSPSSNGASAGGTLGVEPEKSPASAAAARLTGGNVNMPGGYGAPTATVGHSASAAAPVPVQAGATAAGVARGPDAHDDKKESSHVAETVTPADAKLTGAAANLVAAAHDLKGRGDAAAMRAGSSLEAGIMRQITMENKVDSGIRNAISDLQSSGRPVTPEAVAKAAQGVLVDNGLKPDDIDVETAIARASGPPPPPVAPGAYAEAAKAVAAAPVLPPAMRAEIEQFAMKPPPPRAASPTGTLDAFKKNKDVFDKALKDFGVKPEDILAILKVETDLGRNTGKYPLPGTLKAISERVGPDNRPTKAAIQAGRDLVALTRLEAEGQLGGLTINQVYGSYAGAMGTPQFLPSSWAAYSRSPDGGPRDPFNFGTAAYSVGNYLKVHGYNQDVARSIWGYNHSQEYVDKVQGVSAAVKVNLSAAATPVK